MEEIAARRKAHREAHLDQYMTRERAYRKAHRGELNTKARIHQASRKEEVRSYMLLRKFGLSRGAFDFLLDQQGGVCAICAKAEWSDRNPSIDHDHLSGKIRGILCHHCNTAVGMIKDDPKIARAMADYLEARIT